MPRRELTNDEAMLALNLCRLMSVKIGAAHPWIGEGCPSCRSAILALVDGSNSHPTPSSPQVRSSAPQEDTRDGGECIWTRDEFGDPDFYETSCGQAFTFNEGTASDNGVKFCHHCGKPMREVKGNTDEDDSEEDEAVIIDAALLSNPSGDKP